jgi:hypothetical protein
MRKRKERSAEEEAILAAKWKEEQAHIYGRGKRNNHKSANKSVEAVVPSIRLNKLVETWNARGGIGAKAPEKSSEAWLKLAKFVRDNKVTRGQLHYALVKIRGMKDSSAAVVASRLLRFQKDTDASALLDRALAGENVTIRDLRFGAAPDASPEEVVKAKLLGAARTACDGAMKYDVFISEAGAAFALARLKAEARAARRQHIVIDDHEALLPA